MSKSFWRRLWTLERGFTLIEVVVATFIAGTSVVGSVVVMGTAARASSSTAGSLDLQQFAQAQIETVQNAPFSPDGVYPIITGLPEDVTVTLAVSDTGTNYRYPNPDGTFVLNVVQRIDVTVADGGGLRNMSIYKIEP